MMGKYMLKKPILIIILMLSNLSAQSIFEDALSEETAGTIALNFELNGYIRGGIYAGPVPENSKYETKDGYGEVTLKLRLCKGRWGDAYSELRFRNIVNSERSAPAIAMREAYVNAYLEAFDLRIGQQVVQWGKADGYNPSNVVTPIDFQIFSPDEDDRRLSNFLIRFYYNWSIIRLEGIWIPIYKPSVLPFAKAKLPANSHLGAGAYPNVGVENAALALKLHYQAASWDGTLSYFNGYLPMPGLEADIEDNHINIYPIAYRLQMIAADFSTTLGRYGLRGEYAYRKPLESQDIWQSVPNGQVEYILGLDRAFGNFNIIIQYIGKYVFDFSELIPVDQNNPDFIKYQIALRNRMLTGQLKQWSHSISFRPACQCFYETVGIELLGLINFNTEEILLKPKISYDVTDDLQFTAGIQIYHGPTDTLFGVLEEERNAGFLELKASF
jgi:hypothetical protein